MNKTIALLALLLWLAASVAGGGTARAVERSSDAPAASGQIAAVGEDLIMLLPRSTAAVVVFNAARLERIGGIPVSLRDVEAQDEIFEFIKMIGADLGKDVVYVGLGLTLMPAGEVDIINLRYDKGKVQRAIKEKAPGARKETYNGVTVYSCLNDGREKLPAQAALLDSSHIVLSRDSGVKNVIDVYRKKAEPLANAPELIALMNEVDKSGFAWSAVSIPPELIEKGLKSEPLVKAFVAVKGLTVALAEKAQGSFAADIMLFGGTREQNASLTSVLTGLRAMGILAAAKEPVIGDLMNGVAISAGEHHTRVSLTLSLEMIEALMRLAPQQEGGPGPGPGGTGEEWQALLDEAGGLYKKGAHEQALGAGRKALEIAEKNAGPDHPDTALSLNCLALIHQAQGQYAEAEPLIKRALAIAEKALGPDHPDVADCLANFGSLYTDQGRYAEAEPLSKRALAIREKALGPDHPVVVMALDSLARICLDLDRYAEAEPLLERALAIAEKAHGPDHPVVAMVLNDLALLRLDQGRPADAEPLGLRSLAIYEEALGRDHPSVAASLNSLADLYRVQGRSEQAESLYDRSLTITEKTLGPDHALAAKSLSGLAMIYLGQGRFELAEPLLERSLATTEKALGPDYEAVAAILELMAALCLATDREDEAEELEARAARIRAIKRRTSA